MQAVDYARRILQECGLPTQSNLGLVEDCIASLTVKLKCPKVEAARWLWRRVKRAHELRINTNHLWFLDGEYNAIAMEPEQKPAQTYVAIDRGAVLAEQSTAEWETASSAARAKLREICSAPRYRQRHPTNQCQMTVKLLKNGKPFVHEPL